MRWLLTVVFLLVGLGQSSGTEFKIESLQEHEGELVAGISITGNKITKDYVIQREMATRVGYPLDLDILADDLQNLENLGIFGSVRIMPETGVAGLDLEILVTEMPWIVPIPSVSFTEENGWSFGASVGALNLFGRAIKLTGGFLVGGVNTISMELSYPWIYGNHKSLDLFFAHLNRDDPLNEFNETSNEIKPWVGSYLGKNGRLRLGASWFQMRSDRNGVTLDPDNVDDFYRLGASLGVDSRDSWRSPHRGWKNEVVVVGTGPFGGGSGQYWTGILDLRRFQPSVRRQTLVLGALASFQTGEVGVDFPEYLMYRMGGANSIRGYDIETLGKVLFGKNEMIYTVEYQIPIRRIREYRFFKWPVSLGFQFALFADAGVAWNQEKELSLDRFRAGVGAGFRLLVPGSEMVRFDFAIGREGDLRFHLGAESKLTAQRARIR